MGKEIERKFLVNINTWQSIKPKRGKLIVQGYLLNKPGKSVRIRVKEEKGFLTIKGKTDGPVRDEFEYPIPVNEAKILIDEFADSLVKKIRYEINVQDKLWEVDEFVEDNEGLIIAEVELVAENEEIVIPDWVYKEVTNDESYYNVNLAVNPFCKWGC